MSHNRNEKTILDRDGSPVKIGDNRSAEHLAKRGGRQQMYLHLPADNIVALEIEAVEDLHRAIGDWLEAQKTLGDRYGCLKDTAGDWAIVDLTTERYAWAILSGSHLDETVARFLCGSHEGYLLDVIDYVIDGEPTGETYCFPDVPASLVDLDGDLWLSEDGEHFDLNRFPIKGTGFALDKVIRVFGVTA